MGKEIKIHERNQNSLMIQKYDHPSFVPQKG
jgi:hypothetical protein